jgi:hypothetical protein
MPSLDGHPFFISQYLKKLELQVIDDMEPRFLDFSCCPFLEDLKIVGCEIEDPFSSQSLKRLTIHCCSFGDDRRKAICAPNLVSLELEVCGGSICRVPSLQRMPSLLAAYVAIYSSADCIESDSDDDDNQSILLQGLSNVRNLLLLSYDTKIVSLYT